jgi:hypothetical protein
MTKYEEPTEPKLLVKTEPGSISHSYLSTLSMLVEYLTADLQKRQRSFRIGVFSIFIVVAFLSTLLSAVMLSSVIYLKVAENTTGEADIILSPISAVILT